MHNTFMAEVTNCGFCIGGLVVEQTCCQESLDFSFHVSPQVSKNLPLYFFSTSLLSIFFSTKFSEQLFLFSTSSFVASCFGACDERVELPLKSSHKKVVPVIYRVNSIKLPQFRLGLQKTTAF